MHRNIYLSFFFCMTPKGSNDLKLAPENPLLAFRDEFLYFLNRIAL